MRLILIRLSAALAIVIAANVIVDAYIHPFWGNERAWVKLNALKEHADEFNVIILGNSNIAYQLDPDALGGLTVEGSPVRAFNMAVSAQTIEEEIYVYRKILESGIRPNIALLQISHTLSTPRIWNGTARGEYYLTLRALWAIKGNLAEAGKDVAWQRMIFREYVTLYLKKLFHVNLATILEKTYVQSQKTEQILGTGKNGFYSIEGFDGEEWMEERQKTVRDDPGIFQRFSHDVRAVENTSCHDMPLDMNMRSIDELRRLSSQYGVRHVFFVGLPNRHRQVKCMLERIPLSERLESITTLEAPNLFDPNSYFDAYHLQRVPAEEYSRKFAEKFQAFLVREKINDLPR